MNILSYSVDRVSAQNWAGMLVERNDRGMYGLASGMMADLRQVPPYVSTFCDDLYRLLPGDAPSPAAPALHS